MQAAALAKSTAVLLAAVLDWLAVAALGMSTAVQQPVAEPGW